ncbi:TraE/TraK family type IV conjugative transfer system protein [Pseudomonas sp. Irchel 3E13]|uniref:TraE/TraK family type IV conjugative transfer system protein n=1 Tax=Pseudomonas sp. Irchel 3E13 TaxID=2008975 RepID=UPI000BA418D6|nr:TraE/TraK family type IV conjugative transfer system protein [Pseudomonas sp. Irchel 3E13]
MLIDNFKRTFRGTVSENKFLRGMVIALLAIDLLAIVGWLNKNTVIDMQPPTLAERAWVDESSASDEFVEGWALYIADRLGNVTPSSSKVIRKSIEPLLDTDIYQDVVNKIEAQVLQIRQDRVTLRFQPKDVLRDRENNKKFYVTGRSFMTGPNGKPVPKNVTYELDLKVKNYKPVLTYIDTYEGKPKTEDVIRRQEKTAQARKRMEQTNEM